MKDENKKLLKRSGKDTVFRKLFETKKNIQALVKALGVRLNGVNIDNIENITLASVVANTVYNDLGFIIDDVIIILVEAQSSWSDNILIRMLIYIGDTLEIYFRKKKVNLYGSTKVKIPKIEFYVIYTGDNKKKKEIKEISLNDVYFEGKGNIDLKAKVITKGKKENDIISQYVKYTKIVDEIKRKKSCENKKVFAEEVINECIKQNVLKEFFEEHKKEVLTMVELLYNQDIVTENYEMELLNRGIEQGIKQGMQQGIQQGIKQAVYGFTNAINRGVMTVAEAAKDLGISEKEFRSMMPI